MPLVSVLVAAWNEAEGIAAHIESYQRLRYPRKELVLCAGGEDATYDLAAAYAGEGVIVLRQESGEGKQRALRRCLAQAGGEIVFLTDADCLLDDGAFERTLAPIVDGMGTASTGRSKPLARQSGNAFAVYQGAVDWYASLKTPDTSPGLLGRNCAIDRKVLDEVGAFEIDAPTGTDYVLARQLVRAGYSIHSVRSSTVETEYVTTASAYFLQRSRWLRNLILIGLRTGDHRQVYNGFRSAVVGAGLAMMPALALLLGPMILAFWAIALVHGMLSRIRYVALYPSMNGPSKPRLAAVAILSLGLDLLMWGSVLAQSLLPSWRRRWS
jgi:cellulose synthase/poly-beta-1,6-N-acetylglucosamine synthase-like glycosyltransferase